MKAVRIFVALSILLVSSPPAFARVPGCIRGLLLDPRAYVQYVLNRQIGQPAPDWEVVLQASGIPATSPVAGTIASDAFYGITQWKGSAGNVRGRLSLPTATPDSLGYFTRSVDVLADNPAWPVPCWKDARACVWAWREHTDGPAYAPRRCESRRAVSSDFDGDGRSDPTVFRRSDGVWYSLFANGAARGIQWGAATDIPLPGDYDGDGIDDVAVFRPSTGTWYIRYSDTGTAAGFQWGAATDKPVPADYNGDGSTDIAIYRPSDGIWYIWYTGTTVTVGFQWGNPTDIPVPGDYDGDGQADFAIFRPADGSWWIFYSRGGTFATLWGNAADIPVPKDYDGDGATDIAVFRPAEGIWYLKLSSGGQTAGGWGGSGDIPVPGDYNGDGRAELAVFRPSNGVWYFYDPATSATRGVQWGGQSDTPVNRRSP
jgi:hypothetical protein